MIEEERDALIEELRHTLYSVNGNPGGVLQDARNIMDRIAQVHHAVLED